MKPDYDLLVAILRTIRDKPDDGKVITSSEITITGYKEAEVFNALDFLKKNGFIEARNEPSGYDNQFWIIKGITSIGNDFLDQ